MAEVSQASSEVGSPSSLKKPRPNGTAARTRKNTAQRVIAVRKTRMAHTLTYQITAAFALLFTYTFAFTMISIAVGLRRGDDLPLESSLWYGFLSGLDIAGVLALYRELAPDAFEKRNFSVWCAGFSVGVAVVRWLGSWSVIVQGSTEALYSIYAMDGLVTAGGVVGTGIYTVAVARNYNLLQYSKFKVIWFAIVPIMIAFYTGTFFRFSDPILFRRLLICVLLLYFVIQISSLFFDNFWHDELGYVLGVSISSVFLTQLIANLTRILIVALTDVPYSIIIILFIVKSVFFAATCLNREILELCISVDKDSVFPPLFSLQLGEDLFVSMLYLQEGLNGEFAVALVIQLAWNLFRDSGFGLEFYCRYIKGIYSKAEIALFVAKEYYFVQQNQIAESVSAPCVFVLVLTEYVFGNLVRTPIFTVGISRAAREDLLLVYLIIICTKFIGGYVGWKLFKMKLQNLNHYVQSIRIASPGAQAHNARLSRNTRLAQRFGITVESPPDRDINLDDLKHPTRLGEVKEMKEKGDSLTPRSVGHSRQASEDPPGLHNGMPETKQKSTNKNSSVSSLISGNSALIQESEARNFGRVQGRNRFKSVLGFFSLMLPDGRITKATADQFRKHRFLLGITSLVTLSSVRFLAQ